MPEKEAKANQRAVVPNTEQDEEIMLVKKK
jgi:hypothetical protein